MELPSVILPLLLYNSEWQIKRKCNVLTKKHARLILFIEKNQWGSFQHQRLPLRSTPLCASSVYITNIQNPGGEMYILYILTFPKFEGYTWDAPGSGMTILHVFWYVPFITVFLCPVSNFEQVQGESCLFQQICTSVILNRNHI